MAERPARCIVPLLALLFGCSGSIERVDLAAAHEVGPQVADPETERCGVFTDTFAIELPDRTRYVETHNDVCGGRTCALEGSEGLVPVRCLPAAQPWSGIRARHLAGSWFEVRSASEGIAGFAVIEWTPAATRVVLERDLGAQGQVEARVIEGRVALVADCDLEVPGCPLLGPPDAPRTRTWWLDPSGRLAR